MTTDKKILFVAVLAAATFGVWYWYQNSAISASYKAAAASGASPS